MKLHRPSGIDPQLDPKDLSEQTACHGIFFHFAARSPENRASAKIRTPIPRVTIASGSRIYTAATRVAVQRRGVVLRFA
jgi:hypothetical protein